MASVYPHLELTNIDFDFSISEQNEHISICFNGASIGMDEEVLGKLYQAIREFYGDV